MPSRVSLESGIFAGEDHVWTPWFWIVLPKFMAQDFPDVADELEIMPIGMAASNVQPVSVFSVAKNHLGFQERSPQQSSITFPKESTWN